jgi:hypothetical protein
MPPLEIVAENIKVVERGKYEDMKAGEPVRSRHTSVVSSGPSVLRSTLHEAPKAQLSPGIYDDSSARRTPVSYQNTISRGSPMMNRTSDGMLLLLPGMIIFTILSHLWQIGNNQIGSFIDYHKILRLCMKLGP